jgi:hypothetical protein
MMQVELQQDQIIGSVGVRPACYIMTTINLSHFGLLFTIY